MNRAELRKKCTMLVCSCDAYEDCWEPFFKILQAEWPTMPFNIVLNSERKSYSYAGFRIKTFQMYKPNEVAWGKRLKETLKRIKTEYIFFMMDDFFLNEPVKEEKIYQCIDWMDGDSDIQVFSFYYLSGKGIADPKYPGFLRRKQFGAYRFNCQAAVWRRSALIHALRDFEDPWQWELYGNWRSFRQFGKKYYALARSEPLALNYVYQPPALKGVERDAIWRGKWIVPYVDPLFKKHGIEIDYSVRGECSPKLYNYAIRKGQKTKKDYELWYIASLLNLIHNIENVIKHWRHLI